MEVGFDVPIIFVVLFIVIIGGTIYMFQRDKQKVGY
jgi:hypothetical protein